jgi:hypothetical protein
MFNINSFFPLFTVSSLNMNHDFVVGSNAQTCSFLFGQRFPIPDFLSIRSSQEAHLWFMSLQEKPAESFSQIGVVTFSFFFFFVL